MNHNKKLILILVSVFVLSFLSLVFWKLGLNPISYINQLLGKNKSDSSTFGNLKGSNESTTTVNQTVPDGTVVDSSENAKALENLATNFDPAVSSPTFAVESVDAEKKSLGLKFMFPPSSEGTNVNANITCKDDDIKIFTLTKEASPEESVSNDTFFARLQGLSLTGVILSGTCSDATCNEIKSNCRLSVFPVAIK